MNKIIKIKTERYIEKRDNKEIFYNALSWLGFSLLLYSYILNTKNINYFIYNISGSFILIIISNENNDYQLFFINFVWLLYSIYYFFFYLFF